MKIETSKMLKILLIVLIIVFSISPKETLAAGSGSSGGSSSGISFSDAQAFIEKGSSQTEENGLGQGDLDTVGKQFTQIAQILIYIGAGILVGATSYMGIKYMMASPEQQGKLKEQLIGLVVSAMVIFGSYFIWSTLYNLLNTAFSST